MIKKLTTYFLAAVLLGACSSGDEPAPDTGSVSVPGSKEYTFTVYLDSGEGGLSRSPEGDYEPGSGYENYLDIAGEDFRIALYDGADNWMYTIVDPVILPEDDYQSSKRYILQAEVPHQIADFINDTGRVKLVALINWRGNYPAQLAGIKLTDLFNHVTPIEYGDNLPAWPLTEADKIAMFGVAQYNDIRLFEDQVVNLGTLHLLRALAKIEVCNHAESVGEIQSVVLTRHKTIAMPMPKNVSHQDHYVKGNYDGDYVGYTSFPDSWADDDNEITVPLPLVKDDEGNFCIYVPEYKNSNRRSLDCQARLIVTYSDGIESHGGKGGHTFTIDFLNTDKTYHDILRNNVYRFELRRLHRELYMTEDIIPYTSVLLNPGFGLNTEEPYIWTYDALDGWY